MASKRNSRKSGKTQAKPLPTANITKRSIGGTTADVSDYDRVKTPAGNISLDNGDAVAKQLRGKDLDDVYGAVAKAADLSVRELKTRYGHLNPGMQRMNLGNVLRGALRASG